MLADAVINRPVSLTKQASYWQGAFQAMASPCEILMAVDDQSTAEQLLAKAANEAWRIEQKYSRYRDDGIVACINSSQGAPVCVDAETQQLLDFAYQCHALSGGQFDITAGILRKAWPFKTDSKLPTQIQIEQLLPLIGLNQAQWQAPEFSLPAGMQIDFGGIGKEYAVDKTLSLLLEFVDAPILVNFGGDIVCNRSSSNTEPWRVGITAQGSQPHSADDEPLELLELRAGALATSGSTERFIVQGDRRYSHILNPLTGWPVEDVPLSITVAAANCTQAGMLATFAMLQGKAAETFLEEQAVKYWVQR